MKESEERRERRRKEGGIETEKDQSMIQAA